MGACDSVNFKHNKNNLPISQNEKILLQCKESREKLAQYIKALETKEKESREKAKDLIRQKQKDRAKLYLRQCKLYKTQSKISEGKLDLLDEQIMNLENTTLTVDILNALREGNIALQNLQKEVKIEDLEKAKDDMEYLKEKDKEIGEFFKERGIENEADCEEEFNQLEKEVKEVQNDNKINLPSVPNTQLNENKNQIQPNLNMNKNLYVYPNPKANQVIAV